MRFIEVIFFAEVANRHHSGQDLADLPVNLFAMKSKSAKRLLPLVCFGSLSTLADSTSRLAERRDHFSSDLTLEPVAELQEKGEDHEVVAEKKNLGY